jgi:hypothetical protein
VAGGHFGQPTLSNPIDIAFLNEAIANRLAAENHAFNTPALAKKTAQSLDEGIVHRENQNGWALLVFDSGGIERLVQQPIGILQPGRAIKLASG